MTVARVRVTAGALAHATKRFELLPDHDLYAPQVGFRDGFRPGGE